jgi:3-dehydroquinate synthase
LLISFGLIMVLGGGWQPVENQEPIINMARYVQPHTGLSTRFRTPLPPIASNRFRQQIKAQAASPHDDDRFRQQIKAQAQATSLREDTGLEQNQREIMDKATPSALDPAAKYRLAQYDDTWHIVHPGDSVPAQAVFSDAFVVPSVSEYATRSTEKDKSGAGAMAWVSHSEIDFDYRVVEVPHGNLLDPKCDALLFGHLSPGTPERQEAEATAQRRLVVIDKTVNDLYGDRVKAYFEARGVEHEILVLTMTEDNKSMELVLKVAERMKKFNIDRRKEPVLAIGGGVSLDIVGLAASLFRRRTPYIRVPTTALSYIDASVGAKNGVNFAGSKNRLGSYVPPAAALLDSSFFATQPHRDVANGVAEMAKMAIMKSPELYELLEQHGTRLVAEKFTPRSPEDHVPQRVLQLSIQTMLEELSPNLWENSLDRLVDFGHAVGQDLEMAALGGEHELQHGESVAVDMSFMTVLSEQLGLTSEAQRDRTLNMLRGCKLPVWSPVMDYELFTHAVSERVRNSMGQRFPLPVGIGEARIFNDISEADLSRAFHFWEELCAPMGGAQPPLKKIA